MPNNHANRTLDSPDTEASEVIRCKHEQISRNSQGPDAWPVLGKLSGVIVKRYTLIVLVLTEDRD